MHIIYTHIDEITGISLLNVIEDCSFVEVTQRSHVLHAVDAGLMHRHDVIVRKLASLVCSSLQCVQVGKGRGWGGEEWKGRGWGGEGKREQYM